MAQLSSEQSKNASGEMATEMKSDGGKERRVVGQQSRQGKPGTMASPEFVACLGNTGELDISGA